jgi:superfamily II DNA/RNA helicase
MLRDLAAAAARAARRESKLIVLARLLRRAGEPAIVFTEYRDTLRHVAAALGVPALLLHGGMTRNERLAAVDRFTSGAGRLLLATDAAGEGLNLHQSCRLVINLELPWSPVRLEQRIGRVDRIGQRRRVHVVQLIARDSAELRVLSRLQVRVDRMRRAIGGRDPLASDPEREDTIACFALEGKAAINRREASRAAAVGAPAASGEAADPRETHEGSPDRPLESDANVAAEPHDHAVEDDGRGWTGASDRIDRRRDRCRPRLRRVVGADARGGRT